MKLGEYVAAMCYVVIMVILISMSVKSCNSGNKSSDYDPICIKGHLYYRSNFLHKMGITIVLDDEGKPIRCEVTE